MNTAAALCVALAFSPAALGDFVVPNGTNYPWTRGTTGPSSWAQWETFGSVAGPNAPDVGVLTVGTLAPGSYGLSASGLGATVLGSGNIYAAAGPLNVTVNVPSFGLGAGASTVVLMQARTAGTEINPASVLVNGVAPSATTELSRVSLGGQGFQVETLWRWDLPDSPGALTVTFASQMQFFSLDRVAVDQWANVPGPGGAAVMALASLATLRRRR